MANQYGLRYVQQFFSFFHFFLSSHSMVGLDHTRWTRKRHYNCLSAVGSPVCFHLLLLFLFPWASVQYTDFVYVYDYIKHIMWYLLRFICLNFFSSSYFFLRLLCFYSWIIFFSSFSCCCHSFIGTWLSRCCIENSQNNQPFIYFFFFLFAKRNSQSRQHPPQLKRMSILISKSMQSFLFFFRFSSLCWTSEENTEKIHFYLISMNKRFVSE